MHNITHVHLFYTHNCIAEQSIIQHTVYNMHCVAVGIADELKPGEWGEWSACSATCGKGLQSSVRICVCVCVFVWRH